MLFSNKAMWPPRHRWGSKEQDRGKMCSWLLPLAVGLQEALTWDTPRLFYVSAASSFSMSLPMSGMRPDGSSGPFPTGMKPKPIFSCSVCHHVIRVDCVCVLSAWGVHMRQGLSGRFRLVDTHTHTHILKKNKKKHQLRWNDSNPNLASSKYPSGIILTVCIKYHINHKVSLIWIVSAPPHVCMSHGCIADFFWLEQHCLCWHCVIWLSF